MWKVCVVGATGMVGKVMRKVLEERDFPISEFIPVASAKSVGKSVDFAGKSYTLVSMEDALAAKPDIALFSAGGGTSKEWAPRFAEIGCQVIDNSSAWRMDPSVPLVVPEVNGAACSRNDLIIANPNCSTIQMVVPLAPLHEAFGIERIVISTYQSVSGTGYKAMQQLEDERAGLDNGDRVYPHPIDRNCLPHCGDFLENGYTTEEMKLINETRKIMGDDSIMVSPTTVRVPVSGGHSESVNLTFARDFDLEEVRSMLASAPGVTLADKPADCNYPMPLSAEGLDDVFVGRLRRDLSAERSLNMWIVADNLRKGAATNAVQIAELLWCGVAAS